MHVVVLHQTFLSGTVFRTQFVLFLWEFKLIPEWAYQAREPEYEKRDQGQGACYCFNVYTDKKNPENNMVVDADRWNIILYSLLVIEEFPKARLASTGCGHEMVHVS